MGGQHSARVLSFRWVRVAGVTFLLFAAQQSVVFGQDDTVKLKDGEGDPQSIFFIAESKVIRCGSGYLPELKGRADVNVVAVSEGETLTTAGLDDIVVEPPKLFYTASDRDGKAITGSGSGDKFDPYNPEDLSPDSYEGVIAFKRDEQGDFIGRVKEGYEIDWENRQRGDLDVVFSTIVGWKPEVSRVRFGDRFGKKTFNAKVSDCTPHVAITYRILNLDGEPVIANKHLDKELKVFDVMGLGPGGLEAGEYKVGIIFGAENTGPASFTRTLTVEKRKAAIMFNRKYLYQKARDEPVLDPIVTTEPPGLEVSFDFAGFEESLPTEAGAYEFKVRIVDDNWKGTAEETLVLEGCGDVLMTDTVHDYNGEPKEVTVLGPPGLETVIKYRPADTSAEFTTDPPVEPGRYRVRAELTRSLVCGGGVITGTLVIRDPVILKAIGGRKRPVLEISGKVGAEYRIDYSFDLQEWQPVKGVLLEEEVQQITLKPEIKDHTTMYFRSKPMVGASETLDGASR